MEAGRRALTATRRRAWLAVACAAALTFASGCTQHGGTRHGGAAAAGGGPPVSPGPLIDAAAWRPVSLPPDRRGRDLVRAVTACGGRFFAAGAVLAADGTPAPAMWTSPDAMTWTAMAVHPVSAYGPEHTLYAVACLPSRTGGVSVAAIGAASGGAHGNLRINTWYGTPARGLTEIAAPFEQYGGPAQIGTGSIAAGHTATADGWLVTGGRIDADGHVGAAVWQSANGRGFTLIDGDPALETGTGGATEAHGAAVSGAGYFLVGAITPPGSPLAARDPLVWRSPDGRHWTRTVFPRTPGDDVLEQVIAADHAVVALGTDATGFTAWTPAASGAPWRQRAHFGAFTPGAAVPLVAGVTSTADGTLYAAVSDGTADELWRGTPDGAAWTPVPMPLRIEAAPVRAGPRVAAVAAAKATVLLSLDDGTQTRLYTLRRS